jgi:hypothetical protein
MAKAKKAPAPRWDYPEPQETRIGIKVRWYYYTTKEDAEKAAEIAKREAAVRWEQGYDFGYQSPGSIRAPNGPGTNFYPDLYEVCLP